MLQNWAQLLETCRRLRKATIRPGLESDGKSCQGRDDADSIERRFSEAKQEINFARESGAYDFFIVNDNLDLAVAETVAIIKKRQNTAQSTS